MQAPIQYNIHQQNFWLSPQRCVFWQEQSALIVSDLHFGKTGHFRKNGIAVPTDIYKEDLQRLIDQLQFFNAKQIIAVGDLFHSSANKEMELFVKWRNDFSVVSFILVRGNHDILASSWYEQTGITVKEGLYQIDQIGFIHDPAEIPEDIALPPFIFSGPLHPGIRIKGAGKQNLQFPCYYFTKQQAILPAFSKFSGLSMVRPKKEDKVFAIVNDQIMSV